MFKGRPFLTSGDSESMSQMEEDEKPDLEPMDASFNLTKLKASNQKFSSIPDASYSARELFGIDSDWTVPGYEKDHPAVPSIDKTYQFDPDATLAILAGFACEARVMVQGYHGTGKSTHIEQIAARLKWPTLRINLDGSI